jgi:sugar O-acyltransferase (sialic acid O-acetyltransferase NeuD family)
VSDRSLAVYGAGGFAREVAWLAQECGYRVCCLIEDETVVSGASLNGVPILSLDEAVSRFPSAAVAPAIGRPATREIVAGRARSRGRDFATLVHPRTEKSEWLVLGAGVIICAGTILTTNIVVGDHVHLNIGCTIGHDVELDDYATLAPGVHVSGAVKIGRRAYIGTGAVIINGTRRDPLTIGDDAVVGAGACVTRSVPAATTVVGVPARPITK